MSTMYINGVDIAEFGATLLSDYSIGAIEPEVDYQRGRGRTSIEVLALDAGLRGIDFYLEFSGKDRHELMLRKSKVDSLLMGKSELYMPDGFYYTCVPVYIGEMISEGAAGKYLVSKAIYRVQGICHDELQTLELDGYTINCRSTRPKTDCCLQVTAPEAASTFVLGPVTFTNVSAGETLVADGINGRIIQGDVYATDMQMLTLPYLVPGENTIPCTAGDLTVSYYPSYL